MAEKQTSRVQSPFRTRIEWLSQLDVTNNARIHRKTSIVCTIGPKTNTVPMIQTLRKAGMNIARLNFSHGSHEYHGSVVKNIRDSFKDMPGKPVAIALDTKGPEIRTGLTKTGEDVEFKEGHQFILTTDDAYMAAGDSDRIYIDYKALPRSTDVGKFVFIDDGQLRLEVLEVHSDYVKVRAGNSWKIGNNKGVNLPMTTVELPALSERDIRDIGFAVDQGLDMIFASFIRKAEDIAEIRRVLGERGKSLKIIAKIESHEGLENFGSILEAADGIMVARGDLGIEIPVEKVFVAQKMMIARCNAVGKPIITATQMLETMTYNPRPTRAEASDVANAVLDGSDCVMLSGETAKGLYPEETVLMMHSLCREAESTLFYLPLFNELRAVTPKPSSVTETLASSAVNASLEHDAVAIIVLTTSGNSARLVSKYKPIVPILTVTRYSQVARQCHLYRGCYPLIYSQSPKNTAVLESPSNLSSPVAVDQWQEDVDARFMFAIEQGKAMGMLHEGDPVIGIQGWKGGSGHTSVLRIMAVPAAGKELVGAFTHHQ
eukprot:Partr_v1_DN28082_c0_g1_i3_m57488 putative Pyruvate kinase